MPKSVHLDIAGCKIRINNLTDGQEYDFVRYFSTAVDSFDYQINIDSSVQTCTFHLARHIVEVPNVLPHNIWQYVFREILQHFFNRKGSGFIIHCSAIAVNNNAYLFFGANEAGKSTISSFLSKKFKKIADDSGIIFFNKEKKYYSFFQTPFMEKYKLDKSSEEYLVSGGFFLHKNSLCVDKRVTNKSSLFLQLSKQVFTDKLRIKQQMADVLMLANSSVPFYALRFPKDSHKVNEWFLSFLKRGHHFQL